MKFTKLIYLITIFITVLLISCIKPTSYAGEILDLNGTWLPDWSYKEYIKLKEDKKKEFLIQFSWGKGKSISNTTFEIDITAIKPFITEPGLGLFNITETMQIGSSSIKIIAFRGLQDEPTIGRYIEIIFHFIDKNKIWIETKDFIGSSDYGKGNLWHRLSGPEKLE